MIACRELRASGHSVLLLEASTRVGGRCYTAATQGGVLQDLGAEWVQPRVQNLIVGELARYGISLEAGQESAANALAEPLGVNSPELAPLLAAITKDSTRLPLDKLYCPTLASLDVPWSQYLGSLDANPAAVRRMETLTFPFSGVSAEDISALAMLRETQQFGGALAMLTEAEARITGGASALPLAIARELGSEGVRLGATVSRVLAAQGDQAGGCSLVDYTLQCGQQCSARARLAVLVCLPFNALKHVQFLPPLPEPIAEQAKRGHAGGCAKAFLDPSSASFLLSTLQGAPTVLSYPGRCEKKTCVISCGATVEGSRGSSGGDSHNWVLDPLQGGTWLAPRPGQLEHLETLRSLELGGVFFAGGDLSLRWPGWMEGAIASGFAGASRILEILQKRR